jgi:hypothetical protein
MDDPRKLGLDVDTLTVENPVRLAVEILGGLVKAACAVGTSPQTVNRWRHVKKVRNAYFAKRLAELSGVPLEALVGGEPPPTPRPGARAA